MKQHKTVNECENYGGLAYVHLTHIISKDNNNDAHYGCHICQETGKRNFTSETITFHMQFYFWVSAI